MHYGFGGEDSAPLTVRLGVHRCVQDPKRENAVGVEGKRLCPHEMSECVTCCVKRENMMLVEGKCLCPHEMSECVTCCVDCCADCCSL